MVLDVFSDKSGTGWNLSFRSGHEEVKDLFDLVFMLLRVFLGVHELSDQSNHTREIEVSFPLENFMDKEFLIILFLNIVR